MSQDESPNKLNLIGNKLHQFLLNGDPIAPARIAELFLPLIIKRLSKRFVNMPEPDLIDTAAADALCSYLSRPQQFNPDKSGLYSYLCMSADGDLRNLLKQISKDAFITDLQKSVENDDSSSEYIVEIQDDFDLEEFVLNSDSPIWLQVQQIIPDRIDQEILLLMMENVRETAAYAELLNIAVLSTEEQAREVKRHKDRIKKKLQRSINISDLERVNK